MPFVCSLVVLSLITAWVMLVPRLYRLETDRAHRLTVTTADGWDLAIWHRPAQPSRKFLQPVILCHGLANNHALFEFRQPFSLARALSALGFDCYSVDLRGAGESKPPHEGPYEVDVDDHIRFDAPAIIEFVRQHARAPDVLWVGHSLGGLVGLAAATTSARGLVRALVTVGTPVFFDLPRPTRWLLRVARWLAPWGTFDSQVVKVLAPLAGRVNVAVARGAANLDNIEPLAQREMLVNVFAPMWSGVLRQLEDWVSTNTFRSRDRSLDYRVGIGALELPILVAGGSVDHLAPESATRALFGLLTTHERELALFGRAHGHRVDYGHGDLIVGQQAPAEVYPVIARFLMAQARAC